MEEDERLEEILAYLSFISQNGKIQGGRKKKVENVGVQHVNRAGRPWVLYVLAGARA